MPDYNKYLVHLLVNDGEPTARSSAGLILKNNILRNYQQITPEATAYVKAEVVKGLVDPTLMIRNISGNVVTALITVTTIGGWPEILPQLMNMAESGDVTAAEGAMSALSKICEDSAKDLDKDYGGERPLNYMIPKFLQFTSSQSAKVRSLAVSCINQFVVMKSPSLIAHLDAFLNALFTLASDDFPDTRCNVCSAFVNIMGVRSDKLMPHLEGVISFTLHCIKDDDEQVAKEGCEFILQLAETDDIDKTTVAAQLERIIPTILSTMVYSETEKMLLQSIEDDDDVEDKPEDIRPNQVKSKSAHTNKKATNAENDDSDDDSDDDDDDDDGAEAALSEWNLRKCSAAALDVFATKYPELVIQYSLPHLREGIVSQDWAIREASILAFGAVSQGCLDLVGPHLPELIPFLVSTLKDSEGPVRQISCWTLTRYSSWIAFHSAQGTNHELYLQPVLEGFLACCLDKNKKVQESACSALATFTEEVGEELAPYLEVILTQLALCFKKYRSKNLFSLYDSVQTLLDRVGPAVVDPKLVNIILPPLMEKWTLIKDDSQDLWPLFECISSVAASFGALFAPYAADVYKRGLGVLNNGLLMDENCQNNILLDTPDKEFLITSLDMIDGLVQGLQRDMSALIAQTQPSLPELLLSCFEDNVMDVRQSAFALLGDLAMHNIDVLTPYIDQIIKVSLQQMDMEFGAGVCNNAIWSVGEICLQLGPSISPYAEQLFTTLAQVLDLEGPEIPATVSENAGIALGRLGQCVPDLLGPHTSQFIDKWIFYIREILETHEKDSAYVGMCKVVAQYPAALNNEVSLVAFLEAVSSYVDPSAELTEGIINVLSGYKGMLGGEWDTIVGNMNPEGQMAIRQRYGL